MEKNLKKKEKFGISLDKVLEQKKIKATQAKESIQKSMSTSDKKTQREKRSIKNVIKKDQHHQETKNIKKLLKKNNLTSKKDN